MASTQYLVFCRYLNENTNKCVTNHTECEWIGAEEYEDLKEFYNKNKVEYDSLVKKITDGSIKKRNFTVNELKIYTECSKFVEFEEKQKLGTATEEICLIEPYDSMYNDTSGALHRAKSQRDIALYDEIIDQTKSSNPKWDMMFVYDGISKVESRTGRADYNPPPSSTRQVPYGYYDRMKRLKVDPWFLYSTHASLASAMTKVKELVNILGKENVKIGKSVPIDQYVEIV